MFIGEYQHTLDQKGRMAVPVKFRAKLAQGAVVTRGLDGCLFLYPKEAWERLAQRLASLPISQKDSRAFVRLMLAGAMDVEIDRQGRVNIPQYLRIYANIKNYVVIAGLYDRIEIWNKTDWDRYKKEAEKKSVDIAEQMKELNI